MELLIREYIRKEIKTILEKKKRKKKAQRLEIAATGLGASMTGMTGGVRAFWNVPPKIND